MGPEETTSNGVTENVGQQLPQEPTTGAENTPQTFQGMAVPLEPPKNLLPMPTVGRTVLYCLTDWDVPKGYEHAVGKQRPATITEVWGPTCVNLQVLLDAGDNSDGPTTLQRTSVSLNATPEKLPGMWSWPVRV